MSSPASSSSRKRLRDQLAPESNEQLVMKKRRTSSNDPSADCNSSAMHPEPTVPDPDYLRIVEMAKEGGPDLSALRGFDKTPTASANCRSPASSSSEESQSSTSHGSILPYSVAFEGDMREKGIFPPGYLGAGKKPTPKPNNYEQLRDMLRTSSPSTQSQADFELFQFYDDSARSRSEAWPELISLITGGLEVERMYHRHMGIRLDRLERFDPKRSQPKPDAYYGAHPAVFQSPVRDSLQHYITPSSSDGLGTVPMVPNFMRVDKNVSRHKFGARLQAMDLGSYGARAMLELQNYGKTDRVYDENAYTIIALYFSVSATLMLYTTHICPPANPVAYEYQGVRERYYTTLLAAYAMTSDLETFRAAVAAYRNACAWAKVKRDEFIEAANAVAESRAKNAQSGSTLVS